MNNVNKDQANAGMTLEQAQHCIKLKEALDRLRNNPDWKLVVEDHLLKDEAVRLVYAKSNNLLQDAESQAEIMRSIDSIGCLADSLNAVNQFGQLAQKAIADYEEEESFVDTAE